MAATNKHGQALGRKGAESRRRLLDALRDLLATNQPHRITASAIARAAQLASQTFYLYFADIEEALLTLSDEAGHEMDAVRDALAHPRDGASPADHAADFITAFSTYWDRHRAVLTMRNYMADNGHLPFLHLRQAVAMPVIHAIADRIMSAHPGEALDRKAAFARSVVIYSAMERMAARPTTTHEPQLLDRSDLMQAEIDILALLLTPEPPRAR